MNKEGETLVEEEEVLERWREYFEELLRFEVEEVQMEREREVVEEGERTEGILLEEIREPIKTLRNGKSPGTDGLNAELYKTGEGVEVWLLELLNELSLIHISEP